MRSDLDTQIRNALWADITGPVGTRSKALFAVLDRCKELAYAFDDNEVCQYVVGEVREALADELGIGKEW